MHKKLVFRLLGACLALTATSGAEIPKTITLSTFISGTAQAPLNKPIYFAEIPGNPGYYLVLEQHLGKISVFHRASSGSPWTKTLLDTVTLPASVTAANEMGLLGFAFHPRFTENGKYYLYYNSAYTALPGPGARTQVVERATDASRLRRDTSVASRVLLDFASGPYPNHKAGTMEFGPEDGYLYIAVGDGGGTVATSYGNDPGNRAQNPDSLLGKMLRIDVDHSAGGKAYAIPADNPFVGGGHAEEIFALGLRNPFKWSFDREPSTGKAEIWLGHVGQNTLEAATRVPKGANLGWRAVEGNQCNAYIDPVCSMTGFTLPFLAYVHSGAPADSTGNCVIGGYVYRGNPASPYYGLYFMGDNGNGKVWAVRTNGVSTQEWAKVATVPNDGGGQLTSFGTDLQRNLYAVRRGTNSTNATNGEIYALAGPDMIAVPVSPRRSGRGFAPMSGNAALLANPGIRDLMGRSPAKGPLRGGLYVARRPGESSAALIPVLQ